MQYLSAISKWRGAIFKDIVCCLIWGTSYLAKREAGIYHPALRIQCQTMMLPLLSLFLLLPFSSASPVTKVRIAMICGFLCFFHEGAVTFIEVLRRHPNSLKNISKRLLISLFYLLLHPYFSHARECAGTFWKVLVTSRRTTSSITTDSLTHQQNARWEKRKQDWVCFQFLYPQHPWVH